MSYVGDAHAKALAGTVNRMARVYIAKSPPECLKRLLPHPDVLELLAAEQEFWVVLKDVLAPAPHCNHRPLQFHIMDRGLPLPAGHINEAQFHIHRNTSILDEVG